MVVIKLNEKHNAALRSKVVKDDHGNCEKMNILNLSWIDLVCLAVVCVLVNGAITGKFYSHGRSAHPNMIASVKSHRVRVTLLLLAAGLFSPQ
jgi:hypothetical protein